MFKQEMIILDLEYGDQAIAQSHGTLPCILELAAIRVSKEGVELSRYESLVYPHNWDHFTPKIANLTNITREELEVAPKWPEVYSEFIGHVRKTVLSSWGAVDPVILRYQCGFFGINVIHSNKWLDLTTMWQQLTEEPNAPWGLSAVCKRLHLKQPTHRALSDCRAALRIFENTERTEEESDEEDDLQFFEF